MMTRWFACSVFLVIGILAGCAPLQSSSPPDDMPMDDEPDAGLPPDAGSEPDGGTFLAPDEEGCHGIYAQDRLPIFELTIAPEVWDALHEEWLNGIENEQLEDEGLIENYNPNHPLAEFRFGDIVITNAMIRLRGNPMYWLPQNKLQLQISFNEVDPEGRFMGLRKLLFDAASANQSFLRDRLALSFMRELGLPAPCANNARLVINGEYYGLFTNVEKIDKGFLKRVYGSDRNDGDLWKRANWELRTNETTSNDTRLRMLRDASTVAELDAILDVKQALQVWAAEAVIPDSDGTWAGGLNFYLYDDPLTGKFLILPWDLDNTFTRLSHDVDPVTWHKTERYHGRPWYDLALTDPAYFDDYIAEVARALDEGYVVSRLHSRIDEWTEQIQDAAFSDPNKPFSNRVYLEHVEALRQYITNRARFVDQWLACWQSGGVNDGTGRCTLAN